MATLQPIYRKGDDPLDLVIHVLPNRPTGELDEGDLDDLGYCFVDGKYRLGLQVSIGMRDRLHELAIEAFHGLCGVYEPDHFRFLISTFDPAMDRAIRRDLGSWSVVSLTPDGWIKVIQGKDPAPQKKAAG